MSADSVTLWQSLQARLQLLRPYSRRLVFGYLLLFVTSGIQLAYPSAIAMFIDRMVAGVEASWLIGAALVMMAVIIGHALASALRHYLFASTGSRIVAGLRNTFFAAMIRQPVQFFDAENVGELTNRLSTDIEQLQETLTSDLAMLLQTVLVGLGGAIMLVVISPALSLLMLILVPLVVVSMRKVGARSRALAKLRQERLAYCSQLAQEVFANIRLVHAFTQEAREQQRFGSATQETLGYSLSGDRLYAGLEGMVTFIQSMALLVTVLAGGMLVVRNSLSLGELTSFILYAGMTSGAATTLGALWGEWMRAFGATDRVFELLASAPPIETESKQLARLDGEIRFDAVEFCYPTRPEQKALSDFSLTIRPGEKIALVGASGAGKSTVVNLLLGFYEPSQGDIRIDGASMAMLDRANIRSQVAIVEQEPALFGCSILENIRYGAVNSDVSDEAVLQAAKHANIHDVVSKFPDGYQTLVGTRGLQLSGGQKQRVAIARALLRNPRLLILDEATSALDADSEDNVQAALRHIMAGRTTIIIAHRLSTITFADRVVVMREGRMVQCGSHQELMADQRGYYHQLVAKQLLGTTNSCAAVVGEKARDITAFA